MLRQFAVGLAASGSAMLALSGLAGAESFTTRIETRPFYGAVVTLEQGVRVFRPLPPDRQVIINPNHTPLSLGFNDTRVYEQSSNYNYNSGGVPYYGTGGPYYSAPFVGRGFGRGRAGPGNHMAPHRGGGVQVR
jgi:hypothetical protein